MAAMFKVSFRARRTPSTLFSIETVIAKDASEAVKKAAAKMGRLMRTEPDLFASDVTLLGIES